MASGSRENPLQLVQFPFSAGLDEGTRDEVVEAGAGWLVLENGRQEQVGGYSTRTGFTALTDLLVGNIDGYKLFASDRAVCRIAASTASPSAPVVQAYSGASRWTSLGSVPEVSQRLIDVPTISLSGARGGAVSDLAYCNGYFVISWSTATAGALTYSPCVAVVNAATGATVRVPELLGSPTTQQTMRPLLTSYGVYVVVIWESTPGTLSAMYLDTTSYATIANTGWVAFGASLATDEDTNAIYAAHSLSDRVAIFYVNTSGGASRATCKTLDITGVLQTQTINTNSVTPARVALGGSPTDTLWLAWNEAALVRAQGLTPGTLSSTKATKATVMTMIGAGVNFLGITQDQSVGSAAVVANDVTGFQMRKASIATSGGAAVGSAETRVPGANATGRPWLHGIRVYVPAAGDANSTQGTDVVVDFSDEGASYAIRLRPVAVYAPGVTNYQSGFTQTSTGQRTTVAGPVSSKLYMVTQITMSGVADATQIVELDYADPSRWQAVAYGNSTFLSGGVLTVFDGVRAAEVGFLFRPPTPTTSTSATGITATTGWRYVAVYEEVDGDGNWSVSGLSNPSASTGAVANKTVTVSVQPLSITARIGKLAAGTSSLRAALYRTLDGGVAPYYRVGIIPNDTTVTAITYDDTTTDATLAANAKLYEQPGVVGTAQDRRVPPGLSFLASYNGCLVGASGSDVWYSGQNVSGEGAWFNPVFQVPVPGDGDITALWVMDGTLFIAKRREIYAITGEAPSDNGASGGLGLPRRLAVDVGCIEPRSVCVTAFGTFFQSDRGIEILTRAQSVQWIGQPVQETLAAYPIVTSATVEPVDCVVYVECAASEASGLVTGSGRTLVFDLSLQKWVSTDRRTSSAGTANAPSQSACMIYTGTDYRYAWLATDGVVHYGNDTHLDADGSMVAKRAVSPNVRLSGLQGLQHVNKTLLLAKYHTPHDLQMSFAYDYSSTYTTPRLYTAAQLLALSSALPNMQLQDDMSNDARCESVRIQLQDVTPSSGTLGTGQGSTWVALSLEIVPQTGAYLLPEASR